MNLETAQTKFTIDVGQADIYTSTIQYNRPFFFESTQRRMMKSHSLRYITYKTWGGEFFQFSLDRFHNHVCLLLTSTLGDCAFFPAKALSLEKAKARAQSAADNKCPIEGSFSGYYTWGKKLLGQYETLEKHLAEQNVYFSEEILTSIFKELQRRAKHE